MWVEKFYEHLALKVATDSKERGAERERTGSSMKKKEPQLWTGKRKRLKRSAAGTDNSSDC